jgi:hypothetical protein
MRPMIEQLENLPEDILGFRAAGEITASDYTDVLKPAIDAVLRRGEDVRIVLVFDDWSGMTGAAVWEDLKMGIERFTKWKRIALVTDIEWMRHATSLFGWMTPGDVKSFALPDLDAAITWAEAGD